MSRLHPGHPDYHHARNMGGIVVFEPSTILMAATAATSAVSAISQGNAQAASYKVQAQAANYNATIQEQNAARVSQEYSVREDNLRHQQSQFLGRQRAALAQSGTGLGTGSNLDVIAEDAQQAELDALTERYNGQKEREGLLADANRSRYEASVASKNASSERAAGYAGAFSSVLRGAGDYIGYRNKSASLNTPSIGSRMPWQMPGMIAPGGGKYV